MRPKIAKTENGKYDGPTSQGVKSRSMRLIMVHIAPARTPGRRNLLLLSVLSLIRKFRHA